MTQKTVLLVEDNERNRKLVRTVLEFRGHDVVECADGESALPLALAHHPALVLMDIQLPKMDGISVLRLLRENAATAAIPVIAVTASVTPGERERVVAAGFDGYIAKPIDIATFGELVESVMNKGEAMR